MPNIINYKGNVLNVLGSIDQPYFIGAEVGRVLGYRYSTNKGYLGSCIET